MTWPSGACSFARNRADSGRASGSERYEKITAAPGRVGRFEALSENFRVPGGGPLRGLDRIRRDYPMALQGRVALDRADRKPRQATVSLETTVRARAAKFFRHWVSRKSSGAAISRGARWLGSVQQTAERFESSATWPGKERRRSSGPPPNRPRSHRAPTCRPRLAESAACKGRPRTSPPPRDRLPDRRQLSVRRWTAESPACRECRHSSLPPPHKSRVRRASWSMMSEPWLT